MAEDLLHSLIPAANHRFDCGELTMVRELHSAAPARSIPLNGWPAAPQFANEVRHRNSVRDVLSSVATFESLVISAADDVAVTFVDERVG